MSQAGTLLAPNQPQQKSGLGTWAIIGITVGVIIFVVIVIVILILLLGKSKAGRKPSISPAQTLY